MNSKTETMMLEMVKAARAGSYIYPFMWQPVMGRSNTVSAAIRLAKKQGLLVEAGKDGMGKPFYLAPVPAPTHSAPETVN